MDNQIQKLNLSEFIEKWDAVDATKRSNCNSGIYRPGKWSGSRWELSLYEISCFESHRQIWEIVGDSSLDYALILEDDVLLSPSIISILNFIEQTTFSFDVIKVDGVNSVRRFGRPVEGINNQIRPIVEQTIWSSAAYLVSYVGSKKLLSWSRSFSDPLDVFVFTPRSNYELYQLIPAAAIQGMSMRNPRLKNSDISVPGSGVLNLGERGKVKYKGPFLFRARQKLRNMMRRVRMIAYSDRQLVRRDGGWIGRIPLADDLGEYR